MAAAPEGPKIDRVREALKRVREDDNEPDLELGNPDPARVTEQRERLNPEE